MVKLSYHRRIAVLSAAIASAAIVLPAMAATNAWQISSDSAPKAAAFSSQSEYDDYFIIVLDPEPSTPRVSAAEIESRVKRGLARHGYPNLGVSASHDGTVYLAGTLRDEAEKAEVSRLVLRTPGVGSLSFAGVMVHKTYGRAYLGVDTESRDGRVIVTHVYPGSPAEWAGIQVGDAIDNFAGEPVRDSQMLRNILSSQLGGERFPVTVLRDGKPRTIIVRLGIVPPVASQSPSADSDVALHTAHS
jgi:PDZ domain/BON domain